MINILFIILILIIIISYIYNLKNKYFEDYINETGNKFLLFLPLTHKYFYKDKKFIGFISKLFDCIIVALYIKPKYRNKKLFKKYIQNNNSGLILTNNNKIINFLIKHKAKYILNIPYFHIFYL